MKIAQVCLLTGDGVQQLRHHGGHCKKTSRGVSGLRYGPNRSLPEGPRWSSPSPRNKLRLFSQICSFFLRTFTRLLCFQLGSYIALPEDVSGSFLTFLQSTQTPRVHVCPTCRLQDNEVAAVEPPPVVLYSPDSNTGASQPVQPDPHPPTHHKPQDPYSQHPTHPDARYHPDPRYPAPTDPRYPSYTERVNRPDGRYSTHTTQERPTYPFTTPRRPPAPENPVHRHASGPGVGRSRLLRRTDGELTSLTYPHSCT